MFPLQEPVLLQEPDGSYLHIKDITDYNKKYPSYTIDAFILGERFAIVKHVLTGNFKIYASSLALLQTSVLAQANTVLVPEWAITKANNKQAVLSVPILTTEQGEYDVTIVTIPYIDVPGNFTNADYKEGEYGLFNNGFGNYVYRALKDYPLKALPDSNGDWFVLNIITGIPDDFGIFVETYAKVRTRVESVLQENYFDARASVFLTCSSKTITLADVSIYQEDSTEAFGVDNFDFFFYIKITNPIGESTVYSSNGNGTAINPPSVSGAGAAILNYTFETSGVYTIEFINIPTAVVGESYRTGDTVCDKVTQLVYQCAQDVTLTSLAELVSDTVSWSHITIYENITEQFRKIEVLPVLCDEIACVSPNWEKTYCRTCGCKSCKCSWGRKSAMSTVVVYNLINQDYYFKQTDSYKALFDESKKILDHACKC